MASPIKKTQYHFEHNINEIIQKELWSDLSTLLQDGDISDAEQCGAVEAASKHCAESIFLSLISPHCTSSQLHSALPHLASRGLWRAVGHVVQRSVSTPLLTWSVHQAARQSAQQELLSFILPHCAEDQLDSVLAVLVDRGLWRAVGVVIQQVQGTTRRWAIEKACQVAREHELVMYILPACRAVETVCALPEVVGRGLWRAVGKMLQRGVSDTLCIWTLQEAFTHAECELIRNQILPYCTRDYLSRFMSCLISKGRWNDVGKLLQCVEEKVSTSTLDGSPLNRKVQIWTVLGADLERQILQLVAKGRWRDVGAMFTDGDDDSHYNWLIHTACLRATEKDFAQHVLPHCSDRLLDSVLTVMVGRRRWTVVEDVLEQHARDSKKLWAVIEACNNCDEDFNCNKSEDFTLIMEDCGLGYSSSLTEEHLLPRCTQAKLDSVLAILVDCHLWQCSISVLEQGVIDCKKRWAAQTFRVAEKGSFCEMSRKEENDDFIGIVPQSADDQSDDVCGSLLTTLILRALYKALEGEDYDSWNRYHVGISCGFNVNERVYEEYDNFSRFFRHAKDQVDDLLKILVEGRLLRAYGEALKRGVSDSMKLWAMEKACKICIDDDDKDNEVNAEGSAAADSDSGSHNDRYYLGNGENHVCFSCQQVSYYLKNHFHADEYIDEYIKRGKQLPCCADGHLQSVLPTLGKRNMFNSVRSVLKVEVSHVELCNIVHTVFKHANVYLIEIVLPCYLYDDIRSELGILASRRFFPAFLLLLHRFLVDTLRLWAFAQDDTEPEKEVFFWDMVSNPCEGVQMLSPQQWRSVRCSDSHYCPKKRLAWDALLCEVLYEALISTVRETWLCGRAKAVNCQSRTAIKEVRSVTEDIHLHLNNILIGSRSGNILTLLPCIHRLCEKYASNSLRLARPELPAREVDQPPGPAENSSFCTHYMSPNAKIEEEDQYEENGSCSSPLFQLHFLKYLTREYHKRKAWTQMTDAVLVVLTTTPVVPGVQSVALKIMLREKRWDVIHHACLSYACEQDRRQLFQAAVKQKQWGTVKMWADYSLYDDQRLWALGEAKEEKRWDVYLKLAGHGLNEAERMGVLNRVAMHADWKLVRHMVNTVADVSDMKDLLTNTTTTRRSRTKPDTCQQRIEQLTEFEEALKKDTNTLKTLKTAAKRGKWQVVLYNIRHKPDLQHARRALKSAVSSEAWQTVIQLVRLETDVTRRDSLFRDMVRQQQWAVCRELLQQGVSHELCVEALNVLLENRQWTLVAMVMSCPMCEKRRTEMMYRALMMREGSVVWQCINTLQRALSNEERENIFQLAFKREVWQAVKPLVEKKDKTGIRHRDTALLEAIEQHQWDVVDHCQRHHADINMKDDDGHTPIHRAAKKKDWEAVKELTVRDGDPNLLDSAGLSVLHRAIGAKQWDLVKLLIQFHGDIHRPSSDHLGITGLNMLIDARQIDVIESTFMWCADQWKGVNRNGETTLHAACLSGCPGILHDLIARRVNPLTLTSRNRGRLRTPTLGIPTPAVRYEPIAGVSRPFSFTGLSALSCAVLCRDCPQAMVAECIKLGFSTHEPQLTDTVEIEIDWSERSSERKPSRIERERENMLTSPLMLAVMRGLPVVTQMLYESGACSNRQLLMVTALSSTCAELSVSTGRIPREFSTLWRSIHEYDDSAFLPDIVLVKKSADYLRQMSCTPRSLVSTCRLVISHCLTLSKTRHRDIALLPLSPMLKNYLIFTDLTDPDHLGPKE